MYEPMIAKVVHYQVGGKAFQSMKEAKQAAVELDAVTKLNELLRDAIDSNLTHRGNINHVLTVMLNRRDQVRDILAAYGKKQPRAKKCAT